MRLCSCSLLFNGAVWNTLGWNGPLCVHVIVCCKSARARARVLPRARECEDNFEGCVWHSLSSIFFPTAPRHTLLTEKFVKAPAVQQARGEFEGAQEKAGQHYNGLVGGLAMATASVVEWWLGRQRRSSRREPRIYKEEDSNSEFSKIK